MKIYPNLQALFEAAVPQSDEALTGESGNFTMDELRWYLAKEAGPVSYKQEVNSAILKAISEGKVAAIKTKNGFKFVRTPQA